jgi:hypothetical protein
MMFLNVAPKADSVRFWVMAVQRLVTQGVKDANDAAWATVATIPGTVDGVGWELLQHDTVAEGGRHVTGLCAEVGCDLAETGCVPNLAAQ